MIFFTKRAFSSETSGKSRSPQGVVPAPRAFVLSTCFAAFTRKCTESNHCTTHQQNRGWLRSAGNQWLTGAIEELSAGNRLARAVDYLNASELCGEFKIRVRTTPARDALCTGKTRIRNGSDRCFVKKRRPGRVAGNRHAVIFENDPSQ